MAGPLTIGRVAKATLCKVQTVRYYEKIGILPSPGRSAGNQRIYEQSHIERLAFIRHARDLGFTLKSVRELLSLADQPDQPCDVADTIARKHLLQVETRLERLLSLKTELKRMIHQCKGGQISDCRIIQVLHDHHLCLGGHQ